MITIVKTDSTNKDFRDLVAALDQYLAQMNGDQNAFYNQYNKIDLIKHCVVAMDDDMPVGCGAFKEFETGTAEIKRMFTLPEMRNKGIGATVLQALESWAAELGYTSCVLETGIKHYDAIALYKKDGYKIIPNYGQYEGVTNSVCLQKNLI